MLYKLPDMEEILKKCIANTFTHPSTLMLDFRLVSRAPRNI